MDSPVPYVPYGRGSKTILVRRLLTEANGERTAADIAAQVGCTTALVSLVASKSKLNFKCSKGMRAAPAIEPKPLGPDKEKLLRLVLARQLEEILSRQRRIWGKWL